MMCSRLGRNVYAENQTAFDTRDDMQFILIFCCDSHPPFLWISDCLFQDILKRILQHDTS